MELGQGIQTCLKKSQLMIQDCNISYHDIYIYICTLYTFVYIYMYTCIYIYYICIYLNLYLCDLHTLERTSKTVYIRARITSHKHAICHGPNLDHPRGVVMSSMSHQKEGNSRDSKKWDPHFHTLPILRQVGSKLGSPWKSSDSITVGTFSGNI